MTSEKPCVAILGSGFGGLRTALLVSKKLYRAGLKDKCEIVLIDRNDYHTYTPTLYEAATTSKETANYIQLKEILTFPITELIKSTDIRFVQCDITNLDLIGGDIHCLRAGSLGEKIKFDYLVLALGSETNYFGIPGLKEYSLALKTFLDALKIRDKILGFIDGGKTDLKIIIGGGGSTGVELAGEIQEWLCELNEGGRKCNAELMIIEASPAILSGFPPSLRKKAEKRLKNLGIKILTDEAIEKVEKERVILKSGRELPCDLIIWTGGVKASTLMGTLPLKKEQRGRVEVIGEMECLPQSPDLKLYGKIYGLGDAVCFYDPETSKPIPGVARAALSQANVVAHNILEQLKARHNPNYKLLITNYHPMNYPYIIPIGGKWAIAKIGPVIISGFFGWILKGLVELNYLLSIMQFWKAIKVWFRGIKIFIQNDRLG